LPTCLLAYLPSYLLTYSPAYLVSSRCLSGEQPLLIW
jgi:hypothetical protein